ncbi:YybH family protein [Tenacibaculum crassostreae]|uniref:YybH family protein n=1 Tax=Tenacibaculum crassostreae TaxID=502683 RepID=UPI0038965383
MKKLLLIITLLTSTLSFSQNYIGDAKDIKTILNNVAEFSNHVMNGDAKSIGNSYTEDAKIFPNNTKIIEGRKAIITYWTPRNGAKITHHKVTPHEIKINGNEAYDYGVYEGTTQKSDGSSLSWKGKYVIVWKKIDNNWKIYLDIWNNIK